MILIFLTSFSKNIWSFSNAFFIRTSIPLILQNMLEYSSFFHVFILLSSFKMSHLPTAPNGSKHPTHRTTVIRLLKHLSIPRTKANFSLKTNGSWEMILNVSESSIFSHFGYFTFSLCVHLNVYGILGFRRKLFRPNRHLFQVIFKLTLWSQRRRDRKINKTHTKW